MRTLTCDFIWKYLLLTVDHAVTSTKLKLVSVNTISGLIYFNKIIYPIFPLDIKRFLI